MANYMKIKNWDVANGEGLGVSVFFSGCDKKPKCKGCFNSEAWNPAAGEPFDNDVSKKIFEMMSNEHINHLSLLGGEPLAECNYMTVALLVSRAKRWFPNKKIWLWTWRRWEDLMFNENPIYKSILENIDVLVDGEFKLGMRDLTLKWRGSSNQRVINVQESLKRNEIILYEN